MSDYWDITIAQLQPLIAKPTLKPNLLQKPPFRFIHDIVTALMSSTGFPAGLVPSNELETEYVKSMEKEQKLSFLNRLIRIVSLAVGRELDVNATKIIAGAEPEKTNLLLQALAEAANNGAGQKMNQLLQDLESGATPTGAAKRAPAPVAAPVAAAAASAPTPAPVAASSSSSSSSSSAAPRSRSSAPSGALRPTRAPIQLPDGDGSEDFVGVTTRLIGFLIQKPKMTDKLLRKPPFRFLHDIVTAVMAATSYPDGYFTPEELDSGSFANTEAKLSFLQKWIDLVAATNSVDLSSVNPKKIAAGLEPENTNTLLQQFAYAAASGIDARDVAAKLASTGAPASSPTAAPAPAAAAPVRDTRAEEEAAAAAAAAAAAKRKAEEEARKNAALAASQQAQAAAAASKPMPKLGLTGIEPDESKAPEEENVGQRKIERPKTARKAPPKLASNLIEEKKPSPSAPSHGAVDDEKKSGPTESVTLIAEGDNAQDDDDDDDGNDEKVDLGGDPLVGFDGGDLHTGDDGMVVKAMKDKLKGVTPAGDGGMKIRSSATTGGMSQAQLDELRKQIQNLCQSVNPLGKCIDFVREDMDAMNKELSRWRAAYTEYSEELELEKKSTERIVEPLQTQLQEVEAQIAEQQRSIVQHHHDRTISRQVAVKPLAYNNCILTLYSCSRFMFVLFLLFRKIYALKGTILRNDTTIQQLLDNKTVVAQ